MADTTHNLQVRTTVKDLASRELKGLGKTGQGAGKSIAAGFIKAQLALGALKVAIRGVFNVMKAFTTSIADQNDELIKTSQRVGVTVEKLSVLKRAAEFSGAGLTDISTSLKFLQKNFFEVERGSATIVDAFKALGFEGETLRRLMSMDVADAFIEVGKAIGDIGDTAKSTGPAMAILGRSATQLFPLFIDGERGLKSLIERVKHFGGEVTTQQGRIAAGFNDAKTDLDIVIDGIKSKISEVLLPTLTRALNRLSEWVVANKEKIIGFFFKLGDAMVRLAQVTTNAMRLIYRAWLLVTEGVRPNKDDEAFFDEIIANMEKARKALAALRDEAAGGGIGGSAISPEGLSNMAAAFAKAGEAISKAGSAITPEGLANMREAFRIAGEAMGKGALPTVKAEPTNFARFAKGVGDAMAQIREQLKPEALGMTTVTMLTQAWSGFFDAIVFGAEKAEDAFKNMAISMLRQVAQMANQQLIGQIFSALGFAATSSTPLSSTPGADFRSSSYYRGTYRDILSGGLNG